MENSCSEKSSLCGGMHASWKRARGWLSDAYEEDAPEPKQVKMGLAEEPNMAVLEGVDKSGQ